MNDPISPTTAGPPPTLREIAQRAGVSVTAVSLTLNGSTKKVSEEKQRHIQQIARDMGYRSNPLISTRQANARRADSRTLPVLAWVNDHPDPRRWGARAYHRDMRMGAFRRADELGYRMREIWLPDSSGRSSEDYLEQSVKTLRERGVIGALIPHPYNAAHAVLEWASLAVVIMGKIMGKTRCLSGYWRETRPRIEAQQPIIHHEVNPDFFFNTSLAFTSLAAAGYRRIGLAISGYHDREADQLISSAMANELRQIPSSRRVPILHYTDSQPARELGPWIRKHKPDAVIAVQSEVRSVIEKLGLRIPEKIGLAHMDVKFDVPDWSGIRRKSQVIGVQAVNILTASLQRNETGVPPHPIELLVKGEWVQGQTTRAP